MSWQLVSFLILAVVLLAGFAWYERSRPPAQVVALVAALAALAIAGRIAFAAFPNVKPTTDIVIFAGYALGPAPGFAVGAFAALISNFWFGQGVWTPWQMAAWGLCGVLGAGLALVNRNVGRWTLAAVCGLAALGYGAILNFSLMASYGAGDVDGRISWAYFWVLEGRAIPFEAAHAIGNIVLALVAGPAMIRMMVRFRERFEWRRAQGVRIATTGSVATILLAFLLLGAFASTRAQAANGGPKAAVAWLESAQNQDGGFGQSRGAESAQEMTGWAMLGFEAAGVNPQDVTRNGRSPVDYLQGVISTVQSPGDLARTILALEGAGVEPREFGGRNLVAALLARRRKDGSYEGWPNSTAYAVLALRAAGIANVADSVTWLREAQNEDGGWGDIVGSPSNADGTGAVLQVLTPTSKAAKAAVGYLRQVQQKGGGYRLGGNGALNTQSTALAIEGLLAAGADPAEFRRGGKSAYDYLEDNQEGDGRYRYSSKSDQTPVWVTGQVLVAASHHHLPLPAPARAPQPPVTPAPAPTPTPETTPLPLPQEVAPAPTPTPVFPAESSAGGTRSQHAGGGGNGKKGSEGGAGGVGAGAGGTPPLEAPGGGEAALPEHTSPVEPETGESTVSGIPAGESRSASGSGGSVLGSIIAGLLVGGLLFAIGYGPYRRWQQTRGARRPPAAPGVAPPPDGAPPPGVVPPPDGAPPPAWTSPPYPPAPPAAPVAAPPPAVPSPPEQAPINGAAQWPINGPDPHAPGAAPPPRSA